MSGWIIVELDETEVRELNLSLDGRLTSTKGAADEIGQRRAASTKFPKHDERFYYCWQVAGDRGAFYDLPKSISERIDAGVKGELFWQFTAHLENDDNTYRFDTKGLYQQNDGTLTRRYLRRVLLLIEEQERLNMIEDEIIIFNNFKWRESQLQLDT